MKDARLLHAPLGKKQPVEAHLILPSPTLLKWQQLCVEG